LPRGALMFAAKPESKTKAPDATGLPRGALMFAAKPESKTKAPDATGLPRGGSRLLLFSRERESPRDKPVASSLGN
jgi:hypothetical protein